MKNILLPTDFSDNAKNAINYALNLFKDDHCNFFLLNTYTPLIYNYDYRMSSTGYLGEFTDAIKENSIKKLDEIKNELIIKFDNKKHQFEIISSFNLLTDEIKEIIEKKSIDLIVMGTKGATGAKEILFGTNAIHVVQKAKCPVLAVPDGYFFESPKEILFPTDYRIDYATNQLEIVKLIAKLFKSKIHVLNVSHGVELSEKESAHKNILTDLLTNVNHVFHSVKDQPISDAINNFQKSNYMHLLMMVNNKHSFFENLFFKPVINQIGFHLKIPFLVIPATM
jgi:nucleotide-binding universal stress UspA family protein